MDEQLDQHAEAARERWFGSQAAASFLGLHRSTLFLAVQRKHLVPDLFTPGGHARFRQTTLEAFRTQLAKEAATSDKPLYAPVQTLATLAHAVNTVAPLIKPTKLKRDKDISDAVQNVCTSVVRAITAAPLHVSSCLIALRVADPHDPFALRMVAQHGVTRGFLRDYEWLRQQPNTSFATVGAIQSGEPILCPDTSDLSSLPNGSRQLIKEHHIGSYAIFPIVGGGVTLGVLLLINTEPRAFTAYEVTFLRGVADQVATAVTNQNRSDHLSAYASTGRDLTQLALALRAQSAASAPGDSTEAQASAHRALLQLIGVFLNGADAAYVCALGFAGGDAPSLCHDLNALTDRALKDGMCSSVAPNGPDAKPHANQYEKATWMLQGTQATGLAICVPLGGGRRGAIGALWRRPEWPDEDHLLLVTLAGACAMVASPA